MRDKLIKLIERFCRGLTVNDITPPYGYENLAEHLIDHGVTVQEWISVKEMLPERKGLMDDETEYVLVVVDGEIEPFVTMAGYGKDGFDDCDNYGFYNPQRFTHWAYPPHPPKEDDNGK